jgi:UDP-glucose/iron transport system ATP-binding protein
VDPESLMLAVNALRRLHITVSFRLNDGECIALQGPSGVGKSQFLRAIADLDPNEGSVHSSSSANWLLRRHA